MSAIADMVAPVVLITTGVLMALALVIAGVIMLLGGLVVVALAYAPQRGL